MKKLLIIISIVVSFFIYRDALGAYFFQDDWFTLSISRAASLNEFLNFFIPRKDIIYYRPLGMQIPFFTLVSVWGLNPLPFRLLAFAVHALNVLLVYSLLREIKRDSPVPTLGAILYSTSSVFFIPFHWASTFPFLLGPAFYFISLLFFTKYVSSQRTVLGIASFFAFVVGLLINEMVVTLPAVLLFVLVLKKTSRLLSSVIPFCTVSLLYVLGRFVFFTPPTKGLYLMGMGWHFFSNLKTYILWSFNWSEVMTEQMVRPFLFNHLVMDRFFYVAYTSVISFFVLLVPVLAGVFLLFRKKIKKDDRISVILGAAWFVAGLLPVIFFPDHKFSYYLPISLVGFLLSYLVIFENMLRNLPERLDSIKPGLICLMVGVWVFVSFITTFYNRREHWAPRRAKLAKELTGRYRLENTEQRSIFTPYAPENFLALNNQDAFHVLYGNEIVTVYEK